MAGETESKIYELGYHLIPDLEGADAKIQAQEFSNLITQNNGSVLFSKEPKHIHLSYPIRRKHYGYFGTFDFTAPPDAIEKIDAQMKLQSNVLRFLLIKKLRGGEGLRILGEHRAERIKAKPQEPLAQRGGAQTFPEQKEKARKEIKTEEIEKEIEKVIKGL